MPAPITDSARLDFSQLPPAALRTRMLTLIGGRIKPRTNGTRLKEILRSFGGTPAGVVHKCINDLLTDGKLEIRRAGLSRRAGYLYFVTGKQ